MEYRRLGDSDLEVSEVCLGSFLTYGTAVGRKQTEACTGAAFDAGINFFDTANVYGLGAAEQAWGEILADHPRDSFVLASKVYFPMRRKERPWTWRDYGLSRKQIHKQLDGSLKRLRTDYLDLYQCHRYDPDTPLEETMAALTEVVEAGKVRHIGFSEWPPNQIQAGLELPGVAKFVSSQPQYSMLVRGPESEVIPLCRANGISQVAFAPLGQGVLTGKYQPGERPPADSRAANEEMHEVMGDLRDDAVLQRVERLRPIAEQAGLSMAQLALAWVLREENVAAAIVGASRPEQVHENAAASGVKLSDEVLRAIDAALGTAEQPDSAPA
jgi:aryl-alcohol dehydrogenase-like predicted oxidoreductase